LVVLQGVRVLLAGLLLALLAGLLLALPGSARAEPPAVLGTSYGADVWVGPLEPIAILLSRLPDVAEGRIVVFVGRRDVTALLEVDGNGLVYQPYFEPLPDGISEVAVLLEARDRRWLELDRRPLQVGRPPALEETFEDAGFETSQLDPYLDIAALGQVVEHSNDDLGAPERHRFVKGSAAAGWLSQHVVGGFELNSAVNFFGATFKEEALRFAERGRSAPRFDLSDYLVELRRGDASAQVGHVSYGNHRHLLDFFTSRGVKSELSLHPRVDLAAAALSATSIVGYDNLSGLSKWNNRIAAATLGLQLLQNDYGSARLEGTWMSGTRRSLDDFNVGQITDAEKSLGYGARFVADVWSRVRTDWSWARSRFDNPVDPLLSLGNIEFEGESSWDDALFADVAVDVLKDIPLGGERFATVTVHGSYERIDPLFETLGAFTFADTETIQAGFVADLGGVVVSGQRVWFQDNLDDIEQILKTRSHDTLFSVELPLPYLLGSFEQPSWWLPSAFYSYDRFHEYGSNFPDAGSGFDESAIPDQVNERHEVFLVWSYGLANLAYSYRLAHQDNRQRGRNRDDFRDESHRLDASFQLWESLDVGLGGGYTEQWSRALELTRRTRDLNVFFDWRFFTRWTLSASAFFTLEEDSEDLVRSQAGTLDGQLSYDFALPLPGSRDLPGRVYVRASRQASRFDDDAFDFSQRPRQWMLLVGTSITLF
jgi:hypothetical protein